MKWTVVGWSHMKWTIVGLSLMNLTVFVWSYMKLLDQGETKNVKIRRGVRQGCCLSPILFNLYSEYLTKEALEGFGDFKTGGQVIRTVKYADDLVLLAKEETVLQGMIGRLTEIVRYCGM
jgi:hypothetical protein